MAGMLASAGTVSQCASMQPLHGAWAPPSTVARSQEGTTREEHGRQTGQELSDLFRLCFGNRTAPLLPNCVGYEWVPKAAQSLKAGSEIAPLGGKVAR